MVAKTGMEFMFPEYKMSILMLRKRLKQLLISRHWSYTAIKDSDYDFFCLSEKFFQNNNLNISFHDGSSEL